MRILLFIFVLCSLWIPASASTVNGVTIKRLHMYELPAPIGGVFINLEEARAGDPCSGDDREFFIDLNDERGKLLYTHALAAFTAGLKVRIVGTGTCGGHASVELISDLQIYK